MPEVMVALPASISSSSFAMPKVSYICIEGSCQQHIARCEVQVIMPREWMYLPEIDTTGIQNTRLG